MPTPQQGRTNYDRDRPAGGCLHQCAAWLIAMFKAIIANNRAGGWRKLKAHA